MTILLDECVPWPMHKIFPDHQCSSAAQCGWGGLKNGDLLREAERKFDLFITADQNIRYQQNLVDRSISIIELSTNELRRIRDSAVDILTAIATIQPGEFKRVEIK